MKTGLNSIKRELTRLADLDKLKKELKRVADEIKKFDMHIHLTPAAVERLQMLETRFRELLKRVSDLQKQVEGNFEKFVVLVKKTTKNARTAAKKSAKGGARKKAKKKTSRKTSRKKS